MCLIVQELWWLLYYNSWTRTYIFPNIYQIYEPTYQVSVYYKRYFIMKRGFHPKHLCDTYLRFIEPFNTGTCRNKSGIMWWNMGYTFFKCILLNFTHLILFIRYQSMLQRLSRKTECVICYWECEMYIILHREICYFSCILLNISHIKIFMKSL